MLLFLSFFLSFSLFASEAIFDKKCLSCHTKMLSKSETLKNIKKLKAPPMLEVANRVKNAIKVTNNDEDLHKFVVVSFIKNYVKYPDIMSGFCTPMAYEKFDVMPSLKDKISEQDLDSVANWIYDFYEGKEFK